MALGWPLVVCYVVCALVVIPMVLYGITFISRLQAWTQPLWALMLLAPYLWLAFAHPRFAHEMTGLAGLVSGLFVVRARGLTQIMLTLASATMLYELANTAKKITMGDDGLTGYSVAPILGQFSFDIMGRTAFVYGSVVMVVVYALLKHFVNSPLGLVAQGIRENPVRMRLIGVPVYWRLLLVYVIAAAVAGIAGALSAQVNSIVGMDALGFTLSANVLVMLAIGGPGRLYGAFFGAIVFVILSDRAAAIDPTNWLAALGVLLILIVRFAPDGLAGLLQRLQDSWSRKREVEGEGGGQ